jgi:ABC-type amino acid transport substrate-binding protein
MYLKKGEIMYKLFLKTALLVFIIFVFGSCPTVQAENPVDPLRVGVAPYYPPIIFKQDGIIAGVEADLANGLAKELGRQVQFVELRRQQLISKLLDGEIDIIMSGMSITRARKIRVNFADHYLKSGLVPMMHFDDAARFESNETVKQGYLSVGVVAGTTSEAYVRKNFPNVIRIAALTKASDGAVSLKNRSIDVFIHDAPSIMWLVSENETHLTSHWKPLNTEDLAWGVRRDDQKLLDQVNGILKNWKNDGTLTKMLLKWLPAEYLEHFK